MEPPSPRTLKTVRVKKEKAVVYNNPIAMYDIRISATEGDDLEYTRLAKQLKRYCKHWVFQLERGTSKTEANPNGYLHFQGRISLIKRKRKPELISTLNELNIPIPNYLEPTTNPAFYAGDKFYVIKEETREAGPWSDKDKEFIERYMPYQYKGIKEKFYPYQKTIYDSADFREARKINFIYDTTGGKGKSSVASIMEIEGRAIDLPPVNDMTRLIQVMCDVCIDRERDPRCVFVDLPRALPKKALYGMYSGIEQIKKGKLYDTRYNYKQWWIDAPQIWVFSNHPPARKLLSADRWLVWQINDKHELVPFDAAISIETSPPQAESPLDDHRGRGVVVNHLRYAEREESDSDD